MFEKPMYATGLALPSDRGECEAWLSDNFRNGVAKERRVLRHDQSHQHLPQTREQFQIGRAALAGTT